MAASAAYARSHLAGAAVPLTSVVPRSCPRGCRMSCPSSRPPSRRPRPSCPPATPGPRTKVVLSYLLLVPRSLSHISSYSTLCFHSIITSFIFSVNIYSIYNYHYLKKVPVAQPVNLIHTVIYLYFQLY